MVFMNYRVQTRTCEELEQQSQEQSIFYNETIFSLETSHIV